MPTHSHWQEVKLPTEDELRSVMRGEGLSPELWTANDGYRFDVHTHDYHKVVYCVDGSIWFTFPDQQGRVIELEQGDRLDLPAGVRHGALVGMAGVACLEAHKP